MVCILQQLYRGINNWLIVGLTKVKKLTCILELLVECLLAVSKCFVISSSNAETGLNPDDDAELSNVLEFIVGFARGTGGTGLLPVKMSSIDLEERIFALDFRWMGRVWKILTWYNWK